MPASSSRLATKQPAVPAPIMATSAVGEYMLLATQIIIQKLAELISSGDIKEVLDGGQLFALFRSIGINVRMKTKISVEKDGKFVSISDKLRIKSPSTKSD